MGIKIYGALCAPFLCLFIEITVTFCYTYFNSDQVVEAIMSEFTSVVLFTGVLFLALIINLAIKKEYSTKVTGRCIVIAVHRQTLYRQYGL